ncbi:radical SAM superfamily protein [Desulfovibrio sp. A2]|nr:radical SAM superfamily protein [Desulfovibrio sp. A2]
MPMPAAYLSLPPGELTRRAHALVARLAACDICPHRCAADRQHGEHGLCGAGRMAEVADYCLHHGEEAPLVGATGSGTVFFTHCNLSCGFCQNRDISQPPEGYEREQPPRAHRATPEQLAAVFLDLQRQGAANINLVSPSHVAPQIMEALAVAVPAGLALPLVWNSGGYDALSTLRAFDGVVDIYMPDVKFWDPAVAARWCGAHDYPERAREAVAEMHRQVGDLVLAKQVGQDEGAGQAELVGQDGRGMAVRGLLVRHMVLPGGLAGTPQWMRFLAGLSPRTYVNVMGQYRPCGRAVGNAEMGRHPTGAELRAARQTALDAGLTRLDRLNWWEEDLARHLYERLTGGDAPD